MLRELRIKNFAIIDELSINFETGLNVLTGETGAGKSIIIDAIGLIRGVKASSEVIKTGSKDSHIEAYFDNPSHPLLDNLDIESSEGIIIRRNISSHGKGRAYINDTPVSLQSLSIIGESLIDIHGQHEHQGLLKKDSHLFFLDSFGDLTKESKELQSVYNEVFNLKNRVIELKNRIRERCQRIEFLKFQINEIDSTNLKNQEREAIEEEMKILLNLNRLRESSEAAYSLLYESEGSCIEQMSRVLSRVRDMGYFDTTAKELLNVIESILLQLKDASLLLRRYKDKYDIDPQRLTALDERLQQIKRLEKKYGEGIDEILKYREKAQEELLSLQQMDEKQGLLEAELDAKEEKLKAMAEGLSKKRVAAAKEMEKIILGELHELGFQKALFKVDFKKREAVTVNGLDDVEFLFSANPGEAPKSLIKVASGGELSRIMLALKCIEISPYNSEPRTLIFDEVDAGIGGATAQHVGKRLKRLAKNYQVLCITHLPQIAALADNHLRVQKDMIKDAVKVKIEQLGDDERQEELARMLSGKITEGSLKHARELLELAK